MIKHDGLMYIKDDFYHVDLSKFVNEDSEFDPDEDSIDETALFEEIASDFADGEMRLCYDDNSTEYTCAYLFYKRGENFFVQYLYAEDDGKFIFSSDTLLWFTDYHRYMTVSEEVEFFNTLKEYISTTEVPLEAVLSTLQNRRIANPTTSGNLSTEKQDKIKSIVPILKMSGVLLGLLGMLICVIIKATLKSALFGFGVGFGFYSVAFFFAVLFKSRYAFCLLQLFNRQRMTPNDVNWKIFPSIEKYYKPIWYMILSTIIILIAVL